MPHPDWLQQARIIESAEIEVCFLLFDQFYFGPDRHECFDDPKYQAALNHPDIPRVEPSMVRSSEILGEEQKLAAYYKHVLQLAKQHKKKRHEISQYFWLRLWVWNTESEFHIGFPWYDTFSEMVPFLTAIGSKDDGQVFWDADQGWEFEAHQMDQHLYLRLHDPDSDETIETAKLACEPLADRASEVLARTRQAIKTLKKAVGKDYWSKR